MTVDNDNRKRRMGPYLPSRKAAIEAGSKHFFTGVICHQGHLAPRLASNGACMDCHNMKCGKFNKMKRQLDPEWREEVNAKGRLRYHENPLAAYETAKKWRAANDNHRREYNREYMRERRADDPTIAEKERDSMREKRKDPGYVELEREKERLRYAENPEKHREKSRRYAKENPEVAAAHARNRRARIKESEGHHTPQDVEEIHRRQKFRCALCGKSTKEKYDVDHINPISRGGSNWPSNLQILCPTCNRQKNNLDPIVFARRKGWLV